VFLTDIIVCRVTFPHAYFVDDAVYQSEHMLGDIKYFTLHVASINTVYQKSR